MSGKIGTLKGLLSLVGAALTVASFGVLVHLVSPMFGTGMQSLLRALIPAAITGGLIMARRKLAKLSWLQLLRAALIGLGAFATFAFFAVSVHTIQIGTAAGILYGCSIMSSCIAGALFLRERFTIVQLLATLVALGGLCMYAGNLGAAGAGVGILAGACAGVSDGLANCIRKTLRGVDRRTVVMYQYIVNALGALCVVAITSERVVMHPSVAALVGTVCLGLLSLGLGNMLLYGFAHFEVHVGAVVLASQVFFAVLFGVLFLHETPTAHELLGCALVCVGGALTAVDSGKLLAWLSRKGAIYEDV